MFRNYLITAWRNIVKNGMFSFINIFGLAIGLMSCILIMLFVREETGYDQWIKDSDRLVRLHTAYVMPDRPPFLTVNSAGKMMEALRDYAKGEIENGVRVLNFGTTVRQNNDAYSERINLVDGSFFDIFDLPFKHGSKESSFKKPYDLVITEEVALKYFGKTDVVGETITLCCFADDPTTLSITGVLKDLPGATHLDLNMMVYLQPSLFADQPNILDTWNSVNVMTYFKMHQGVSVAQLQERIEYWINNESPFVQMFKENMGELPSDSKLTDMVKHRVMAVPDLHLQAKEHAGSMGDVTPMGDLKMIYTFIIVAALILLIACINFMNLATARASQRAKEVAMRKVMGASRRQVATQFLGEAIALVFISLLFALVAVEAVLPLYNSALSRELELRLFEDADLILSLLGTSLLVGLGAGIYPALYLSRYLPVHILKSSKGAESSSSSTLRTALVVFQFVTSISLIISTAVVYGQTVYANSMDVGYETENKLILNIRSAENLESLKQELLNLPELSSVVFSSESPTQDNENNNGFKLLEQDQDGSNSQGELLNYHNMGYGFFEAYDIKPIAGRLFDQAHTTDEIKPIANGDDRIGNANVILNETAVKKFGFTSPQQAIGKTLESDVFRAGKYHLTIIGVIPDIYFRSIKFGVRASAYMLNPERFRMASLSFNTRDVSSLLPKIETIWKANVPMQPVDMQFLSEMMNAQYAQEMAQAKLFSAFSILAILVACLGLYGLAAFTAERRTKEIGIRKVMGARVRDIVSLLIWQFSKPVIIAMLVAWPISAYLMLQWLEAFPYRINTFWLLPICLAAGGGALLIAWLTVGGNAAKVARSNPIKALHYE
ncbi:ABC transporter permease [Thalassotalea psychrophila]|uniref:ABC transporter permease n=1 Tax=Thalassotalea psychrophila TaxID=3065647 RepID=A0ABY9TY15_9GAMM|nr:ABC transporter permease [Colwelliaceae bacterium SQ149]